MELNQYIKDVLDKFESVVRCLIRIKLEIKNLYEKQEDNIEVLIELSETVDTQEKFGRLIGKYKEILNEKVEVVVNTENYKVICTNMNESRKVGLGNIISHVHYIKIIILSKIINQIIKKR
jgi:hypothetical protein